MPGLGIVRRSVRRSAARLAMMLLLVGIVAISGALSSACAMEVRGQLQQANGEGVVGGELLFDEKSGSALDRTHHVDEDGFFEGDLAAGREYSVKWRVKGAINAELESWVLPYGAAGTAMHIFGITDIEDCGDGKGCLRLAYWRVVVSEETSPPLFVPDRTSLWQGLGGVATAGEHYDRGAAIGFVAVGGWRWRDYGDGIPLLEGFGKRTALDVWVQYASTRYEIEQLLDPNGTADVIFHRLTLSAGPTWLLREIKLGGGDQLHIEAGVGPSIAIGAVLDGTDVLGVDFGSGNGEERNYRFAGVGFSAWNTWWWNRPGMDLGVLIRFDYTDYIADGVASPDGEFEDQWYGGVSGLSFSLIFR